MPVIDHRVDSPLGFPRARGRWWAWLLVCVAGFFQTLHAQRKDPISIHFSVEQGLPHKNVFCVLQDRDHLLWFGTEHGVSRFDGLKFENFTSADGLSDNVVIQIKQDRKGRIWFLPVSGHPTYFADGFIHNSHNTPWLEALKMSNFCSLFHEDDFGNLYFGSGSGDLFKLNDDNCVTPLITDQACCLAYRWILGMRVVNPDSIIVHTQLGCYEIVTPSGIKSYDAFEFDFATTNYYPVKSFLNSRNEIFSTWSNYVGIIDSNLNITQHFFVVPGGYGRNIVYSGEDSRGKIWFGTSKGAFRVDPRELGCEPELSLLQDHQVQYVLEDHEGGLWLCTSNGIYFYPSLSFRSTSQHAFGPNVQATAFLKISPGEFLIGSENSEVFRYNLASNELTRIYSPQTLAANPIHSIRNIGEGILWIFSRDKSYEYLNDSVQIFSTRKIIDAVKVGDDLCLCLPRGVYIVDYNQRYRTGFASKNVLSRISLVSGRCYAIEADSSDAIWIAAGTGLYRYHAQSVERVSRLDPYLTHGTITDVKTDQNGDMWVATDACGVFHIHQDSIYNFRHRDGLASDEVGQLSVGDDNRIWVATPEGVSCIIPQPGGGKASTKVLSSFLTRDIRQIEASQGYVFMLRASDLIVLKDTTLMGLKPTPKAVILKILADAKEFSPKSEIHLNYNESALTVHFTGISFQAPQSLIFRYRVLGANLDWVTTDARSVSFSNLPSGKYRFELQVQAFNGAWSPETASFSFSVETPFWLTAPFIVLASAFTLILGALFIGGLLSLVRRRAENRRRLLEAEHKALISQMNPHFIFNSLNSIQNYFLARDIETANEYLADFSNLMRAILDSGRMNKTSLADEIALVRLYLNIERMRTGEKFEYRVQIDPDVSLEKVFIPPLLLQPFLENAIWHGIAPKETPGTIEISVKRIESGVRCYITDNGIGRAAAEALQGKLGVQRRSHATSIVKERLMLLNQVRRNHFVFAIEDLYDAERNATGTRVRFDFPQPYP